MPPAPGKIARRVSGRATVVVEPKTRICVVSASSRPPPNAGAARAEMVGIGNCEIDVNVPRSDARKFAVLQLFVSSYLHILRRDGTYSS